MGLPCRTALQSRSGLLKLIEKVWNDASRRLSAVLNLSVVLELKFSTAACDAEYRTTIKPTLRSGLETRTTRFPGNIGLCDSWSCSPKRPPFAAAGAGAGDVDDFADSASE